MSAWDFENGNKEEKGAQDTGRREEDRSEDVEQEAQQEIPAEPEAGEDDPEQPAESAPAETEAGEEAAPEDNEAAAEEPVEAEVMSMDQVDLDAAGPAQLKPGDIIEGVVASVGEQGVLVDVGGKAEGLVPAYEFVDRSEMPEVDDRIEVAVVKLQDDEGVTLLSKKRADYERVWNRVIEAMETGEILDAMVTDRVRGGLRVDIGVAGFVPASHVATRDVRNLDRFVGRSLRLKVLEADRNTKKVVLSHRQVVEEERRLRREETMERLQEGLVCEGKVRNITNYGAFIDLGGVDGLLHVSEMAWGRVEHPSEVCKVGDTLRVVVLEIDQERDRISLGRRQILPDPWKQVAKEIRTGALVKGRISRIVRNGAFVELPELEVEGFLPVGELSDKRVESPSEIIEEGQEIDLKVIKLRPQARRMTLSLIEAAHEKERQEYQQYMSEQDEPKTTLGDQFADVLTAVAAELDDEDVETAEAEAEEVEAEEVETEEVEAEEVEAEEAEAEEVETEEVEAEEVETEEVETEETETEETETEETETEETEAEEVETEEVETEEVEAEEVEAEEVEAEEAEAEEVETEEVETEEVETEEVETEETETEETETEEAEAEEAEAEEAEAEEAETEEVETEEVEAEETEAEETEAEETETEETETEETETEETETEETETEETEAEETEAEEVETEETEAEETEAEEVEAEEVEAEETESDEEAEKNGRDGSQRGSP